MTTPENAMQGGAMKIEDLPIAIHPAATPLIYIDGFQGFGIFSDSVRINAYQVSQNLESTDAPPFRVFTARLAMSPATALQLVKWLSENLKAAGILEVEATGDGKAQ